MLKLSGSWIGLVRGGTRKNPKKDDDGKVIGHDAYYSVEMVDPEIERSRRFEIQDGRDLAAFQGLVMGETVDVQLAAYPKRGVFKRQDGGEYEGTAFDLKVIGVVGLGAAS